MAKTAVKKVVLELNGKDVELTMAQARELHAALNELFEEKVRQVPYPVYREPYIWPWRKPYWLCSSGTKAMLSDSSVRLSVKS